MTATKLPIVVLIATGGTIAMRQGRSIKAAGAPTLSGDDLAAQRPEILEWARLEVVNLFNVPSEYMNPERWLQLRSVAQEALNREEVAGVVVAHGTDTMEESAFFLDLTLTGEKPVVLVGAQRSASDQDCDGPRNLVNAVRICVTREARGKGVLICMNDQINAAREASKTSTNEVETFKSGNFGFLGQVDPDGVHFYRQPLERRTLKAGKTLPGVDIVYAYAGADETLLQAAGRQARGVVVAALGCGNVPEGMYKGIKDLCRAGVRVVISSRVPNGRVFPAYDYPGGGKSLKEAGALFADNLSPQHARVLLMLALGAEDETGRPENIFS